MRIFFDADGVIAGWGDQWDSHAIHKLHLGLKLTKDQKSFNLREGLTPAGVAAVQEIMDHPEFYRTLKPIEGAREAMNRLRAEGHEVYILTAPWLSNPTCASDKIEWVKEHIGPEWADRVIIAKDKSLVMGDILIDDRPDVMNKDRAVWRQVYFTQPYNVNEAGPRIDNWTDGSWYDVIQSVSEDVYAW